MGVPNFRYNQKEYTAKQLIHRLKRQKKQKRSRATKGFYSEIIVMLKDCEVKLFFHKSTHKGTWHILITTNTSLSFAQAHKIYTMRWQIEVFFKEAKQYLGMGKNQSRDFDSQIAHISIAMIQYNLLSKVKRFVSYETLGALFRGTKMDHRELTITERIYNIIIGIATDIAKMFDINVYHIMEKILAHNQQLEKYIQLKNSNILVS